MKTKFKFTSTNDPGVDRLLKAVCRICMAWDRDDVRDVRLAISDIQEEADTLAARGKGRTQ